ncbi:MAG: hypothetical protein IPJ39_15120 [Saprospiraceae bacterium]|nr:hypothetical protein [Saprospiraceae bacterium]
MSSILNEAWIKILGKNGEYHVPNEGLEVRFGKYSIPSELYELVKAHKSGKIDTSTLGFEITFATYYRVSPFDCINFAHTGGDGDHFAFLTDFEHYDNIYECPIAFICPMDDEDTHFLFAKNFKDFLSIMCQIKSAEQIRLKDLKTYDFAQGLLEYENDILEWGPSHKEMEIKTINFIKDKFGTDNIDNLNEYYIDFYQSRSSKEFIKTLDTYNLLLNNEIDFHQNWLSHKIEIIELKECILSATTDELKIFLRNMPYIYEWWDNDYPIYFQILFDTLPEYFKREKIIVSEILKDIEIEKEKSSKILQI